jgi:hypothetical protein
MSFDVERSLIETTLKTGNTALAGNAMAIQYPNTPFQPDASVGFVRLTILGGEGNLSAIVGASSPTRHPGVIDLAIFRPREAGMKPSRTWADYLAGILANKSLQSGTVRIVTFTPRLDDLGEVGDWRQANLSIPFVRDDN